MYREQKDMRKALIISIIDLVINFAMLAAVTGTIPIPPILLCITYGLYAATILIAGLIAIITLVVLMTKFKKELAEDMKWGRDGYNKNDETKLPLHNCLVMRGMALAAFFMSFSSIMYNVIYGMEIPMYQTLFLIYVGIYAVLSGISLILSKVMNYHEKYQWIINLPMNDRNSKLVQEYKDIIDTMRLEGDIWHGELAAERKKIDNYFCSILQ